MSVYCEVIEAIVEAGGSVDVEDGDGATPLVMAASTQNSNAITKLIELNADPNLSCGWDVSRYANTKKGTAWVIGDG